jgi:hypothetical protein
MRRYTCPHSLIYSLIDFPCLDAFLNADFSAHTAAITVTVTVMDDLLRYSGFRKASILSIWAITVLTVKITAPTAYGYEQCADSCDSYAQCADNCDSYEQCADSCDSYEQCADSCGSYEQCADSCDHGTDTGQDLTLKVTATVYGEE